MKGKDKTAEQRLKMINRYISKMPSLSTTVTKVMETCNNPAVSPNDLNRVISLDPVLTGQVIKLVNSAYYALVNEVTSLIRAIIMLGINTIKNLALSLSVMGVIKDRDAFRAFTIDEFWSHSICVGVSAKLIAAATGVPANESEEFFVAGLLHDLGKIPLNSCYPADYQAAVKAVKTENIPLYVAEQNLFGVNHCQVGGIIAEKWTLNLNLADTLNYHHFPDDPGIENKKFLTIITLADMIAHMLPIADWNRISFTGSAIENLAGRIDIDLDTFKELKAPVTAELEKARTFLQVTAQG
ncbi:MAG: Metal-dependent phosphohydrolase, HD subdomain [Olavius algarvensis Delta 4 endosymbiont]|nr:MAG: Metal-dependent phosphohydrolase, HD subdomain [Olavius algarvensis Delta 4 endosymbiont]